MRRSVSRFAVTLRSVTLPPVPVMKLSSSAGLCPPRSSVRVTSPVTVAPSSAVVPHAVSV